MLDLMITVMKGFVGGVDCFKTLLNQLLCICTVNEDFTRRIIHTSTDTSDNRPLEEGIIHCLHYGNTHEQTNVPNAGRFQDERTLHHKVLLPRTNVHRRSRSSSRSPTRSRSPSPIGELQFQVETRRPCNNPGQLVTMQDMLNNPDEYVLMSNVLHSYFESYKPLLHKKNI